MKRTIGMLLVAVLAICLVSMVEARPYKPLGISDYTVDIPDDAVVPQRVAALEMASESYGQAPDGSVLIVNQYQDPDFQYFGADGRERYPYVEIMKWEEGTQYPLHLIGVVFINDSVQFEGYADKNALRNPASDKLERQQVPVGPLKKVPRVK